MKFELVARNVEERATGVVNFSDLPLNANISVDGRLIGKTEALKLHNEGYLGPMFTVTKSFLDKALDEMYNRVTKGKSFERYEADDNGEIIIFDIEG